MVRISKLFKSWDFQLKKQEMLLFVQISEPLYMESKKDRGVSHPASINIVFKFYFRPAGQKGSEGI
jgi:hypothetical protein